MSELLVLFLASFFLPSRAERTHFLRVVAAFLAEREREAAERLAAALRAWRDSAVFDAAL